MYLETMKLIPNAYSNLEPLIITRLSWRLGKDRNCH